jgi:hypothetical protein
VTSPVRGLVLEIHRSVNRMRFGIMGIVLLKSAIPVGVTSSKGGGARNSVNSRHGLLWNRLRRSFPHKKGPYAARAIAGKRALIAKT